MTPKTLKTASLAVAALGLALLVMMVTTEGEPGALPLGLVSAGPMASTRCMIMGPASSAATMRMMVTPVSVSPAAMARSMGAAPRQAGSNEAWTFTGMSRGTSSTAWGRIMP